MDVKQVEKEKDVSPSLPKLLAALALGAKSVNSLPLSSSKRSHNENTSVSESGSEEDDGDADDEFSYQMAFPEFNNLCLESRSKLASMLKHALKSTATHSSDEMVDDYEFDDPILWESAAEACDILLERIDIYIQNVKEGRAGLNDGRIHEAIGRVGDIARNKAKGGFDQLVGSLVEMTKPQVTYNFASTVQNSRLDPFIPVMHPERPFALNKSRNIGLIPGHALESRFFGGASAEYLKSIPDDIVAPSEHFPHLYKEEIESLTYRSYQLEVSNLKNGTSIGIHGTSGTLNNPELSANKGVWIDKEEDLIRLVKRIIDASEDVKEIAIDLEAHSFRSFNGFVCLMQLSLRRPAVTDGTLAKISSDEDGVATHYDFLIDTLALRDVMNEYFAPMMANPDIVKVMHGADSDIQWLQRDFGIYVVNLFDTGRACRALPHFSKAALAYLLSKYANVEADKQHQLSDWRQRPLPPDMLSYAVSDTMYLLDIYDKIRLELMKYATDINNIRVETVLNESKKVCLIRYDKEPFRPSSYKKLIRSKRGKKMNAVLSDSQDATLKALFDWRDSIAREEDESSQFVCSNTGLVRIATICPQTVGILQTCVNPLPPLVLKYANDILRLVKESNSGDSSEISHWKKSDRFRSMASPTAFFNKTSVDARNAARNGMMSPVLGTDDLYKQAGWTTPLPNQDEEEGHITSSSNTDVQDVSTHMANQDFCATKFASHSLEMKPAGNIVNEGSRSKSVDGLGAAKATTGSCQESNDVDEQNEIAQQCASRIRERMASGNQNLLGIVTPSKKIEESDADGTRDSSNDVFGKSNHEKTDNNDEFIIPKSMKEIYRMSNRNRQKSKKTQVHFSDDEDNSIGGAMNIEEAEHLISMSGPDGKDYFDSSATKRQRTKSNDAVGMEQNIDRKEDDVELMMSLGWVKDRSEADAMITEQKQSLETGGDSNDHKDVKTRSTGSNDITSSRQQGKSRREKRGTKQSNTSYDYSKVSAIGVGGPSTSDNPFFVGAAVSGCSQSQSVTGKDRKKVNPTRKGGKRNNSYGGHGGNKSYVYRGGK